MTPDRDPYVVLGLAPGASPAAIRTAYRRLARLYHPDRSDDPASVSRMIELNAAWEALRRRPDRPARTAERGPDGKPAQRVVRRGAGGREIVWERGADGVGGAGPPPGRPKGAILDFGRYLAWSLGEIARIDPWYLLWLDEQPQAEPIRAELREWLTELGLRKAPAEAFRHR